MAQKTETFVPRVPSAVRRHARRDLTGGKRTRMSVQPDSLREQQVSYSLIECHTGSMVAMR